MNALYVDDGRVSYDCDDSSVQEGESVIDKLSGRFGVKYGEVDATDDYFLGANRRTSKERDAVSWSATTYIDAMVDRYCNGGVSPGEK